MATTDRIPTPVEWSDWKYGDWGSFGPELTGQHWRGINCQVYEDGTLGPRPGWRLLKTLSTTDALEPQAIVWRREGQNRYLHLEGVVGNDHTIRIIPITISDPGATPTGGTVGAIDPGIPTSIVPSFTVDPGYWSSRIGNPSHPFYHVASSGEGELVTVNGTVYEEVLDGADYDVGTRVAAGGGNPVIAEPYGVRMFYAGVQGAETSYYYSEPNDFDNLLSDAEDPESVNTADTSISNSPLSGIVMLKEMGEGLLFGTLDGRLLTLRGATPKAGVFRLLQTVGAPYLPSNYVLVADQVFFVPIDSRGVTIASVDGVNSSSFNHLRFLEHTGVLKRGGIVTRAIGNRYNQYCMFVSEKDSDHTFTTGVEPYTTLEFNNGVWHLGEVQFVERVDYCTVPGGKLAKAVHDGATTKVYVRDETNNSPVPGSWSQSLRGEDVFPDNTGITEDELTSSIVVLPEFKLHGAAELQMESLVIELDYWNDDTYTPELHSHIRMLTPTDVSSLPDSQPIEDVFGIEWGPNLLASPWSSGRPPWLTRKKRTTETSFVLPEGLKQRWYVLVPGMSNIQLGNGFQLALKFRDLAVRRIIPTVNVQQWLQYINEIKALGAAPSWGGRRG